jgi:1,4-alpha-glucan branching enzyme
MALHKVRGCSYSAVQRVQCTVHQVVRLLVHSLAGEGWLNFIGNEFGHPEWLDFPRAGNMVQCYSAVYCSALQESYHYARRQWGLADDPDLRYGQLNLWDQAVNMLVEARGWLGAGPGHVSTKHEEDKVIVFERAGLLFAFNLHPVRSLADYTVGVEAAGRYTIVLDSDSEEFGGQGRRDPSVAAFTMERAQQGRAR